MHGIAFIITNEKPTVDMLEQVMMPFHTYEADGIEDYTVIEDITAEVEEEYESRKGYGSIQEFAEEEYGCSVGVRNGKPFFYTRTNPNAKWDSYQLGDGHTKFLKEISESGCPIIAKQNIDYAQVRDNNISTLQCMYDHVTKIAEQYCLEKDKTQDDLCHEDMLAILSLTQGLPECETLDVVVLKQMLSDKWLLEDIVLQKLVPNAVLWEGHWYSDLDINYPGWIRKFMELWNKIPADCYVSVVDYHY